MQNRDPYKLLYNNLWLHKSSNPIVNTHTPSEKKFVNPTMKSIVNAVPSKLTEQIQELNLGTQITAMDASQVSKSDKSLANSSTLDSATNLVNNNIIQSSGLIHNWNTLVSNITNCTKCDLCLNRKNVVIERGERSAKWMFVGEGPGEQEDIQGKPFVGASGQLLQKMIIAMQLDPAIDVYICNVVKCRPPSNRNPEPKEIELCRNYLFSQIELVKPQIIITLGRFAHQTLLNTSVALGRLRLKQHYYNGTPLIVTYHPAYLLRNPSAKKDAWADLQLAIRVFKEMTS